MNLKQKILKAIESNRLKLVEWKRNWYNYIISVQELVWSRNLMDWYFIYVYDNDWSHLETVELEIKPVFELWWVHNKIFLKK